MLPLQKHKIMKKAGLVGGMGPLSTIPYYHDTVYGVRARTRDDFFPDLTIESVNVFEILEMCGREDYQAITQRLLGAVRNLAAAGCDFAALTANTSHIVFDQLQALSPIPLLSIVEATCREAMRRGDRTIALLGTRFTMLRDFYKQPFVREGIEVVIPDEREIDYIDKVITSELELGIVRPETLNRFREIISRLVKDEGAENVILGCTELPLLLNDGNSPVPCLDTVKIHVAEIVDNILS